MEKMTIKRASEACEQISISQGQADRARFIVFPSTVEGGGTVANPIKDCHTLANSGPFCSTQKTARDEKGMLRNDFYNTEAI